MLKKIISLILLVVWVVGCATDQQRTKAQGAGLGAAAGAAVGAAIGAAAGGKEGALKGALIGGGIGLIGGYAYATHVANLKAQYVKEEDYLDACIASAEKVNQETRQYNAYLESEIRDQEQEVDRLIDAYNSKQVTKTELKKKQQSLQASLNEAEKKLQRARDEIVIQREVLRREQGQSQARLAALNAKIKQLEQSVAELEQTTEHLAAINQKMSI
jgi:hypothetical protein